MRLVIFGLSLSSSWGNGHATIWRGLCRGLHDRGHEVVFFERDVPYYAEHRDLPNANYAQLELYPSWEKGLPRIDRELANADAAIVTSYCPDALAVTELLVRSQFPLRVFYDLDAPVTLERLRTGQAVDYIGPRGLRDFQLVLSFTGGTTLLALQRELGAPRVAPLYGAADPLVHRPVPPVETFRGDLSYLGTYAQDRQQTLQELFINASRRAPQKRFVLAGALYPPAFPWTENIFFVRHLAPGDHAAFYCSSRITLNVTRAAMAQMGYCPSGRLFEAAASGVVILSDWWEGLAEFFEPGLEILIAQSTEDTLNALELGDQELAAIGQAAQARVLAQHTAQHRAEELEGLLAGRSIQPATSHYSHAPAQPAAVAMANLTR